MALRPYHEPPTESRRPFTLRAADGRGSPPPPVGARWLVPVSARQRDALRRATSLLERLDGFVDDAQVLTALVEACPPADGAAADAVDGGSAAVLTARQREILILMASGLGTEDIAGRLFLSRSTVRNHVARILRQLGCHSRLAAVARAREQGLI
jgi:DNA-binding NarL/FixJ family response regulator